MRIAFVMVAVTVAACGPAACGAVETPAAPPGAAAPAATYPAPCDLTCGRCRAEAADPACCPPAEAGHRRGGGPPEGPVDLDLSTLDGRRLRVADLRGEVVLVNVWATWCGPCRAEMPDLVRLHEAYRGRGFRVVAISVDEPRHHDGADPLPAVREFVRAYGLPFDVAMAPADLEARLGAIESIPMSYLVGRDGRIVRVYEGARSFRVFEKDLREIL